MTQLVFLTNLVKKVGGVFEAARVTSDCVGDHNACAAANDGHLATGGLVAGPEALAHLHFSSRCGPSQFVRRIWHIGGGTGAYKAVRGGGPGMSPGAKGKRHCIVSSVISHGGKQQETGETAVLMPTRKQRIRQKQKEECSYSKTSSTAAAALIPAAAAAARMLR